MINLGTLTPKDIFTALASDKAWLEERRLGIGASDAPTIMKGEWGGLWQDKMGLVEHNDLSYEFMAMYGKFTEPFNLAWFERMTKNKVYRQPKTLWHDEHAMMFVHLDGYCSLGPIECKAYMPFTKNEEAVEKAYWQCVHNMVVTNEKRCALSVMFGNLRYKEFWIDRVESDVDKLIAEETRFWGYVQRKEAPPDMAAHEVTVAFDTMREVDMTADNEFGAAAADWLANKDASKKFTEAAEVLKAKVESDVKLATGKTVKVTRSSAGALTVREIKEPKKRKK